MIEEIKSLKNFADEILYISFFDVCAEKQNVDEGLRLLDEIQSSAHCSLLLHAQHHGEPLGLRAAQYVGACRKSLSTHCHMGTLGNATSNHEMYQTQE